jgi:2-polyprenyl-6-methoxyphenol hydroxylase-like FAD-dependent oxidoreductase
VPARCKFVAMMPQWEFLDFVRTQASAYPSFHLVMNAEVADLLWREERVMGVRLADGRNIHARLVVGCDGRHSTVRARANLAVKELGAPIDVLWLRVPRRPDDAESVFGIITASQFLVMFDRGDYWQCAFLIAKGGLDELKARGLPMFRDGLRELAPFLGDRVDTIRTWDDVKLLTVMVDRLVEWARPGVLCIGDAAHAMSPVGGVGINLAIQDAVATANLLWRPLRDRAPYDLDLVQLRREHATIKTQALQLRIHDAILAKVMQGRATRTLRFARWMLRRMPLLRRYIARAIGVGFQPEHVAQLG